MAYRKSLKGDSNQANEEWSHNRITIVAGGAGIILVCFVCCLVLAAILWMAIKEGTLFSILIIGAFLAFFLGAGIAGACFLTVRISDALTKVQVNKILASTVIAGELVAYRNGDEWDHLSAQHEMAKIPQHAGGVQVTEERADYTDSMITELYDKGLSRRAIAKALEVPYNRVQQLLQGKP
jgi:hypothetical protein